jgi:hypothetical protein
VASLAAAKTRAVTTPPFASRKRGSCSIRVCPTVHPPGCDEPHISERSRRSRIPASSVNFCERLPAAFRRRPPGRLSDREVALRVHKPVGAWGCRFTLPCAESVRFCTGEWPQFCSSAQWSIALRARFHRGSSRGKTSASREIQRTGGQSCARNEIQGWNRRSHYM